MLFLFVLNSCSSDSKSENDYLIAVSEDEYFDMSSSVAYADTKGNIVIPYGKYNYCYTDTFRTYAIVLDDDFNCFAIDRNEKKLYDIFWIDNRPDYVSEGLFRIIIDEKIGFADEKTGKIVIEPKYKCAFPFEEGIAKVAFECSSEQMGENEIWNSDNWFYINRKGEVVE